MLGFSPRSLLVLLVAGARVPAAAEATQNCELNNSGECKTADDLLSEAQQLVEKLLLSAKGSSKKSELLDEAKKIFGDKLDSSITSDEEEDDDRYYADRYMQQILDIIEDEECMSGSLDVSSDDYTAEEAVRIFNKCRLLHLRNFFPTDFLKDYKRDVTSYVTGIASGRISEQGQTSYANEPFYFAENAEKRFDLCFTEDLINEEIMASEDLLDILEDELVLGRYARMLDFGAIMAEPGAPLQGWHRDGGDYLFSNSFYTSQIGGHDLPPFAVAVITPLLNVTMDHGPTEFCMGTSNLVGIDVVHPDYVPVKDPKLRKDMQKWVDSSEEYCPAKAWRTPVLSFGDVLLFDYNLMHRGGPNNSPEFRAMIYNTYSRPWYADQNFSEEESEKATHAKELKNPLAKFSEELQEMASNVRIAIPDEIKPEDPEFYANIKFDDLEKLQQFRPSHHAEVYHSEYDDNYSWEFHVTNIDIEGLTLCLEEIECIALPAGRDVVAEAKTNAEFSILSQDDKVVKKFTVEFDQPQVVVSSHNTKL